MIDIKPYVETLLSSIPDVTVSDNFPNDFKKLPHISFYELGNVDVLKIKDGPLHDITIQVDIWHKRSTGTLAAQVNEKLNSIGLRRAFAQDMNTSEVKRKTMRYRGTVDTRTLRVTQ